MVSSEDSDSEEEQLEQQQKQQQQDKGKGKIAVRKRPSPGADAVDDEGGDDGEVQGLEDASDGEEVVYEEEEERIMLQAEEGDMVIVESSDEDDEEGGGEKDPDAHEDVSVDFEFCDPKEDDFFMVKSLMHQGVTGLVPGMGDLLSDLTEDVCTQAACGTTITVDDQVYSFVSALAAKHYHDQPYMVNLLKVLEAQCPSNKKGALKAAQDEGLAWLLSERLVNMPNDVVPPLYEAIVDDIAWARENVKETGGTEEMFDFKNILVFAPCYTESEQAKVNNESDGEESDNEAEQASKKRPKVGNGKQPAGTAGALDASNILYFEHEPLIDAATVSFPIKLATPEKLEGKAKGAVPQRHKPKRALALILPLEQLKCKLPEIKAMLSQ